MIVAQPPVWPGAMAPRPQFAPQPVQAYAPQAPQAFAPQPTSPGWSRPSAPIAASPVVAAPVPALARAPQNGFVARGAMPDAPASPAFKLPPPEALGIRPAARAVVPVAATAAVSTEPMDWTRARQQMASLGVRSFQFETMTDGRHRFVCALADSHGRQQLVEASATTEAEAVRQALERASLLRQGR